MCKTIQTFKEIGIGLGLSVLLFTGCGTDGHENNAKEGDHSKIERGTAQDANETTDTKDTSDTNGEGGQIVRKETKNTFGQAVFHFTDQESFDRAVLKERGKEPEPIALSRDYNTTAYFIPNGDGNSKKVILRPKVYFRSSTHLERVRPIREMDGRLQFNLLMAFADGLNDEIATGVGATALPKDYLIKDKEVFLSELAEKLGQKPEFVGSVNCPKKVTLHSRFDGDFQIEFRSGLKTCPINTFFPVQLTLSERDWKALRESFISEDNLEIRTSIDLGAAITRRSIEFNLIPEVIEQKLRLRESEKSALTQDRIAFSSIELKNVMDQLLAEIQSEFKLSLAPELFFNFRDQVVDEYFETVQGQACGIPSNLCFRMKDGPFRKKRFNFWILEKLPNGNSKYLESISSIGDWAQSRQPILVQSKSTSLLTPPGQGEVNQAFRTIQEGDLLELSINEFRIGEPGMEIPKVTIDHRQGCRKPYSVCQEGQWRYISDPTEADFHKAFSKSPWATRYMDPEYAEIAMISSVIMHRSGDLARGFNTTGPYADEKRRALTELINSELFQKLDKDLRGAFVRLFPFPKLPFRLDKGFEGQELLDEFPNLRWESTKIDDNQCDPQDLEDQWVKVTRWSTPALSTRWVARDLKAENWRDIFSSVAIVFTSINENGEEKILCQLSDIETRVIPPNRMILNLKNTEKCSPFDDSNKELGRAPHISFISKVSFPSEFQCGQMVEDWRGRRMYTCRLPDGTELTLNSTVAEDTTRLARGQKIGIWQPYYPRTEIQGTLKVIGSVLESAGEKYLW